MIKLYRDILAFLPILMIGSCSVVEYHPFDTDLSDLRENINGINLTKLSQQAPESDTIRFVWTGDTQRAYEETELFVNHINGRSDIDFLINGGDIVDFGTKQEHIWIDDIMKNTNIPYFTVIGNHDLLGRGEVIYRKMYGELDFSFIYNRVKFICLNTNYLESSESENVPNLTFLEEEIADSISGDYDHTVVSMHIAPKEFNFNTSREDEFHRLIKSSKGFLFCTFAHVHNFSARDLFNDGAIYYSCDDMAGREYLLFTIAKGRYDYERVKF